MIFKQSVHLSRMFMVLVFISLVVFLVSRKEQATGSAHHQITLISSTGGELTVDKENAFEGETVTLTALPDDCFELDYIYLTTKDETILLEGMTFVMPDEDVTLSAEFKEFLCTPTFDEVEGDIFIRFDMHHIGYVGQHLEINYTKSHPEYDVIITSSHPDVASIIDDALYLGAPGTSYIHVQYERLNYSATFQVEVRMYYPLAIEAPTELHRGEAYQMIVEDPNDLNQRGVTYHSSDDMIATISPRGYIYAHRTGTVTFTITSNTTKTSYEHVIVITNPDPNQLEITNIKESYEVNQRVSLAHHLFPIYAEGMVLGTSSNPDIITVIDGTTLIIKDLPGVVTLTFYIEDHPDVFVTHEVTVTSPYQLDDLINLMAASPIMAKDITVFGYQYNYTHALKGSVIPYYFGTNTVIDAMILLSHKNRLGIVAPIHYIVIHDTGSTASGAHEAAHSSYVRNPDTSVSWHYTVGANEIYRHIPDQEQAFHAGDGGRVYQLFDTFVPAVNPHPVVTIDAQVYFELDGVKSSIKAPMAGTRLARTEDIVYTGIRVVVGDSGNYMIGSTYYSGLGKISNTGGDKNGIGIEMTIYEGSDLYRAYQKLAKLVADLLVTHNLTPDDVKQHNFFSGKNCPQTLRQAGYWDVFMDMVHVEFLWARYFPNYTFELINLSPDWINDHGRLIYMVSPNTTVDFTLQVPHQDTLVATYPISKELPNSA